MTTGLVLQELLQGFAGPRDRTLILDRFSAVPLLAPDREGTTSTPPNSEMFVAVPAFKIGTIDALLAQLCIRHRLTMLSIDNDFKRAAEHSALKLWNGGE